MFGKCSICGDDLGNSVVSGDGTFSHPLCHYKRESERPRDEVVAELRRQVSRLRSEGRVLTPCVICGWPRPPDNEHNICECCGFQEGYDNPGVYTWDGEWWSMDDEMPLILKRALSRGNPE